MAIHFEANYSKKLGLPNYSSHQYSVTINTEVNDPNQVAAESTRLYDLLQSCVDREIQKTGFLPEVKSATPRNNGNGHNESWGCSPKQRELILKIVEEQHLDKSQVEKLAQDRFGKAVKALNKLEASGLIEELMPRRGAINGRAGGR
jgi:hypothetical protein